MSMKPGKLYLAREDASLGFCYKEPMDGCGRFRGSIESGKVYMFLSQEFVPSELEAFSPWPGNYVFWMLDPYGRKIGIPFGSETRSFNVKVLREAECRMEEAFERLQNGRK